MNTKSEAVSVVNRARVVLDRLHHPGLAAAFLYGSVNEDRQRDDSDVDIAVLDREDARLSWTDQAILANELERAISRPVDLQILRDCPLSLQVHVVREGRQFWEKEKLAVNEFRASVIQRYEHNRRDRELHWKRMLHSFAERESNSHEPRLPR